MRICGTLFERMANQTLHGLALLLVRMSGTACGRFGYADTTDAGRLPDIATPDALVSDEGTLSVASLTFTASDWNVPQQVDVAGVDDPWPDANDLTIINLHNDTARVVIQPNARLCTTASGGVWTFALSLGTRPTFNVTMSLASSDAVPFEQATYVKASSTSSGAVHVFTRVAGVWSQQAYINASSATESEIFGSDVAISADGTRIAVGASGEGSNATGINGDHFSELTSQRGAVFIFEAIP